MPASASRPEICGRGKSSHRRDTVPMAAALRCGARTRKWVPCRAPALRSGSCCRMHGGAASGPPTANRNAWKHRYYAAAEINRVRDLRRMIHEMETFLAVLPPVALPARFAAPKQRYRYTVHSVVPRIFGPPPSPIVKSCTAATSSPYIKCRCRNRVHSRQIRPINVLPQSRGTSGGST